MVPSASIISNEPAVFALGAVVPENQIRDPGVVKPCIEPVFGQDPVINFAILQFGVEEKAACTGR